MLEDTVFKAFKPQDDGRRICASANGFSNNPPLVSPNSYPAFERAYLINSDRIALYDRSSDD
jgi:hypothetical protein